MLDAEAMMARPVAVEPVKVTMSTRGSAVRWVPTSAPPVMTLRTPGGSSASWAARAISKASRGVHGCGLSTTVQPTARAGTTLTRFKKNGKLNGVMAATTPAGSRTMTSPLRTEGPP